MIGFLFILILAILTFLLWLGFKITGALLSACIWLFILLPLSLAVMLLGLVLCCTIILIPVGIGLLKMGCRMLMPG